MMEVFIEKTYIFIEKHDKIIYIFLIPSTYLKFSRTSVVLIDNKNENTKFYTTNIFKR